MLEESIAFSKLPVNELTRVEDRVSFLYLEHMRIVQEKHGVVGLFSDEEGLQKYRIQIPVGGISLLMLGPGTSVTNAALTSMSRSGCTVLFTTGSGITTHSYMQPLTASSKWAIAQAYAASTPQEAKKIAKSFYRKQFGQEFNGSIAEMRGIEGSLMKKSYRYHSQKYRLGHFKRDTKAEDSVNLALNILNGILYGLAATSCQALGLSTSLGIIHRGHTNSFLYDIADWYKVQIAIPIAFSLSKEDPKDIPRLARKAIREEIEKQKLLKDIVNTLIKTFTPYLPKTETYTLIGDVTAQINYGTDDEPKLGSPL